MTNSPLTKKENSPSLEILNVSANHAGLIARELEKLGVDTKALFEEADVELPQTHNPAKRISVEQVIRLLKLAIQKTGDHTVALKIYQNANLGDFDALGFAISCSTTYLSMLQRFQRFSQYIVSRAAIRIVEEPDGYLFLADMEGDDLNTTMPDTPSSGAIADLTKENKGFLILLEALGIGFLKLSSDVCQTPIRPTKAYILAPSHPDIKQAFEEYGAGCEFIEAPFYGVKFNKDIAEKKLPMANPQMARLNDEIIMKHLEEMFQNDVVFQVESMINDGLPVGEFSRSDVAVKMGMSERKLQQKLDERNTSFSDILLRIRKTLAMQYIREDKLRINQIAYALGFTNGSNFSRSFKSWTGYTPNEFKDL